MRSFVVYTLARVGLFLAVYGLIWLGLFRTVRWDSVSALYTALIAMAVSSLLAFVALRRLRADLAAEIAQRSQQRREPTGSPKRWQDQSSEDADGVPEFGEPGVPKDGNQRRPGGSSTYDR